MIQQVRNALLFSFRSGGRAAALLALTAFLLPHMAFAGATARVHGVESVAPRFSDNASPQAVGAGYTTLEVELFGQHLEMDLESNDLFASGAAVVSIGDDGATPLDLDGRFLKGSVRGEPGSWVRVSVLGDGIEALIDTGEDVFVIEPSAHFGAAAQAASDHVAYRLADVDTDVPVSCGAEDGAAPTRGRRRHQTFGSAVSSDLGDLAQLQAVGGVTKRAEIHAVGDYELTLIYGTAASAAQRIASVFNAVSGIYEDQVGVEISLLSLTTFSSNVDPFTVGPNPPCGGANCACTDHNALLDQVDASREGNNPWSLINGGAIAHLITGRELCDNIIGVAYTGVLCRGDGASSGLSQDYTSNLGLVSKLVSHEVGHNFSAGHDPSQGSCSGTLDRFIMHPSISSCVQDAFSSGSKLQMNNHIAVASCLVDLPEGTPTPTRTPTRTFTPTFTPTPRANEAQFVSQSVPAQMNAGQQYAVSVVMRNTGSNTWFPGSYKLGSQNPHENRNWGSSRIDLTTTVAPGQNGVFSWTVTAPASVGTFNFQWRMLNVGVEWFGALSDNVAVSVTGGAPLAPNDAAFVGQNVPTQMNAGQAYAVSVTMRNTGSNTWAPGSYVLGAQNPHDNRNWGPSRIDLAAPVAPGQNAVVSWVVTAPTTPGVYNFQWRMLNVGVAWFGAQSANLAVDVTGSALPPNDARFVSHSVPAVMTAGQTYQVTVRMRNAGSNTWTPASYRLGSQNPHENKLWGMSRVALPASVAPGQDAIVTWTITAPTVGGTYNFQWRMLNVGVEWFGERSDNVVVSVEGGAEAQNDSAFVAVSVPSAMSRGQQATVSVTMRNTGTTTWTTSAYQLGAQNPHDNANWGMSRVALNSTVAPGENLVLSWTITAPQTAGSYNFQWKLVNIGVEWFGQTSTNVVVNVQ